MAPQTSGPADSTVSTQPPIAYVQDGRTTGSASGERDGGVNEVGGIVNSHQALHLMSTSKAHASSATTASPTAMYILRSSIPNFARHEKIAMSRMKTTGGGGLCV